MIWVWYLRVAVQQFRWQLGGQLCPRRMGFSKNMTRLVDRQQPTASWWQLKWNQSVACIFELPDERSLYCIKIKLAVLSISQMPPGLKTRLRFDTFRHRIAVVCFSQMRQPRPAFPQLKLSQVVCRHRRLEWCSPHELCSWGWLSHMRLLHVYAASQSG
jgi:hypothetical protein